MSESDKGSFFERLGCFSREKGKERSSILPSLDRRDSVLQPLSKQFFMGLLDLEERFARHDNSVKIINELGSLYATLIEHYDQKDDPITLYFSEKLENLFSSHSTLRALRKNKRPSICSSHPPSMDASDPSSKMGNIAAKLYSGFELNNIEAESEDTIESHKILENKPKSRSLAAKRMERQTKAKIILELEKKKDVEIAQTSKLVVNFIEKSTENDDVVRNDLKKQLKNIKDKIKQKRSVLGVGSFLIDSNMNSFSCAADSKDIFDNEISNRSALQEFLS